MTDTAGSFDIAEIAIQWIELFGDDAPEKAWRKADVLRRTGDDTAAEWHKTIAVVARHLLDKPPA
jgi:hypothetical protein